MPSPPPPPSPRKPSSSQPASSPPPQKPEANQSDELDLVPEAPRPQSRAPKSAPAAPSHARTQPPQAAASAPRRKSLADPDMKPAISGMGILSIVLGVVGVGTSMFGGGIVGVAAIIAAVIGLRQIRKNPKYIGGIGFAYTGLSIGAAAALISLYLFILVPYVFKQSEAASRADCAANLSRILKATINYGAANNETFPLVQPPTQGAATLSFGGGAPVSTPQVAINNYYKKGTDRGNMTANLWILVLKEYNKPQDFICPADPNNTAAAAANLSNFAGVENFSYAFAIPWDQLGNKQGFWKNIADSATPLIADQGPLQGDVIEEGTVNVSIVQSNGKLWNSPIHKRLGQVVGWADGHADFNFRPNIGMADDNIWTTGSNGPSPTGQPIPYGSGTATGGFTRTSTYANGGSPVNWDIIMVPSRGADGKTY